MYALYCVSYETSYRGRESLIIDRTLQILSNFRSSTLKYAVLLIDAAASI